MPRYNPDRNERAANRGRHQNRQTSRPQTSEFLELIQLQLQAANERDRIRNQQNRRHHSRSRSPQPQNHSVRRRSLSPRQAIARQQNSRPTTSPPPPRFRQDLDPRGQVGQTARPSPEAEELVLGWNSYNADRESQQRPAADNYRPNYTETPRQDAEAENFRGLSGHRHHRGRNNRGGRNHRGQRGGRSLFDRINL
jgi:hypothetical protein